jgi:hypothetical protein
MNKVNFFRIGGLFAMMTLLTACPYQSKVPISEATEKINKDLLGEWISTSELDFDNPTYYEIKKYNKVKYEVLENSYSVYDSLYSTKIYLMHASVVQNKTFMNVEDIEAADGFYLYKMEFENDKFTLFELTDDIDEQFDSSADLRAFIEKNMHLSFFYVKGETEFIKKPN